jgi:hypothetical protein
MSYIVHPFLKSLIACDYCINWIKIDDFVQHIATHPAVKCCFCKNFFPANQIILHRLDCYYLQNSCKYCHIEFSSIWEKFDHEDVCLYHKHDTNAKHIEFEYDKPLSFSCDTCELMFSSYDQVLKHKCHY